MVPVVLFHVVTAIPLAHVVSSFVCVAQFSDTSLMYFTSIQMSDPGSVDLFSCESLSL